MTCICSLASFCSPYAIERRLHTTEPKYPHRELNTITSTTIRFFLLLPCIFCMKKPLTFRLIYSNIYLILTITLQEPVEWFPCSEYNEIVADEAVT